MSSTRAGITAGALALTLCGPALAGDGSDYSNNALVGPEGTACSYCVVNAPEDGFAPPFQFDWSVGLRGAVRDDGSGDGPTYELLALPQFSLRQKTIRGSYNLGISGEISQKLDGDARIGSAAVTAGGDYALDASTTLAGKLDLTMSQDDPDDAGQPANVATAPVVMSGAAEASVTRAFGPLTVALRGSAGRQVYGETTYTDASSTSNEYQNTTTWGAGARLGYKLVPGLVAFVDSNAVAEEYDIASPTLMVRLDNSTYTTRTGVTFSPSRALELEGSVGWGYRDFIDGTLDDFSAMLYGARAQFRPNETLTLTGEFTTSIGSPGTTSGATAKLTHAVTGTLAYVVNPWLRLRASTDWRTARYEGIATEEKAWGFGVGADYLLNEQTDLTADYSFQRSETTPADPEDQHQVMLGVKFRK